MSEADDDDGGAMLLPDDYDASDAPENMDLDEELPLHHLPMDFNNPEHTRDLGSFHAIKFYEYAARYGAQLALEYLVKNSQFRGDIKGEMGKLALYLIMRSLCMLRLPRLLPNCRHDYRKCSAPYLFLSTKCTISARLCQ